MHQALKTFDILDTIFSCLRDYPPEGYYDHHFPWNYNILRKYNLESRENVESTQRRKALLRSALCCKHFSSLALKHLWWNQTTLKNILKLLPGYTFVRSENKIAIDGFLDDEGWERADMYAKLVRNIVIYDASPPKLNIEKSTYHQIQASRKFLFPNLREIYCDGRLEDVCLLFSPSLRRLVILEDKCLDPPSPAMYTFISALPKICPDLQSLEVYLCDLPSSAMRSIQRLQNLQHLGLEFVPSQESNIEHYTSISLLPNLRLLQLSGSRAHLPAPEFPKFLPTFYSPEAFCALQQLDFYGSLESVANWLPSFISPNLTTFTAEFDTTWTDDEEENELLAKELYYQLCDTLAKNARSPLSTLQTLSFITISNSSDVLPTEVEAFQPLLALRGLETLVFDIPLNGFDDPTLIKWARAWSNLKTFRVEASSGDDSTITLFGVKELFQLCLDLKSMRLPFHATKLDSVPEVPTTPSLHHGLKDWDIAVSQVNSAMLGPVLAILNWVFLDIWDVKSRRFEMAEYAVSEVLPHSLERVVVQV